MKFEGQKLTIKLYHVNPLVLHGSAFSVAVLPDRVRIYLGVEIYASWRASEVESIIESRHRYGEIED